jgi:hypothetical protein
MATHVVMGRELGVAGTHYEHAVSQDIERLVIPRKKMLSVSRRKTSSEK